MEKLEILHLRTLKERRNRSDQTEVFNMVKEYVKYISDFLILDNGREGTRGRSATLAKIRSNRDVMMFFQKGLERWTSWISTLWMQRA